MRTEIVDREQRGGGQHQKSEEGTMDSIPAQDRGSALDG